MSVADAAAVDLKFEEGAAQMFRWCRKWSNGVQRQAPGGERDALHLAGASTSAMQLSMQSSKAFCAVSFDAQVVRKLMNVLNGKHAHGVNDDLARGCLPQLQIE